MSDAIFVILQGGVTFPSLEEKTNADGSYTKFKMTLIFDDKNTAKVNEAVKKLRKDYPKLQKKFAVSTAEKDYFKDIPKDLNFTHTKSMSSNIEYIRCVDFFDNKINIQDLKVGDLVIVKCQVKATKNEGGVYPSFYVNKIKKYKENAFQLSFTESEESSAADDEFKAMVEEIEKQNNLNNINDEDVEMDDDPDWE